ncbi:hypothetical protein UA08_08507 [Talaromyces atroroseus]|uniref:Clr5 domain-containing protein n=1 Tax=Talaromyces atroroseus TaxID=1441469 RepID=A0A1Q5Q7S6_TALAT|nr:hypothetical protein UA08_08507 [Talaromyces atroroseus]OKL56263.1 hypothetical protein UA08_08507 [Talaromyces atroroseus]
MVDFRSTQSTKVNLSEIVRLYVIENWTLDEVMFEMEQRFSQSKSKLSKDGWKRFLNTQETFDDFYFTCASEWAPDERGLYARSDKLRTELTCLSNLHNLSVRALNQFKEGKEDMGWAMMQPVYQTQEKVVDIRHHRQIVDIFAIIRLFYKDNFGEICKKMINKFSELASPLADNDLRKLIFES